MKSLKKQYKDTFDNIKLDDKKINENLYKIIRNDNKKKIVKNFNYVLVNSILIALLIIISMTSVVAYIDDIERFKVKENKKIEYTFPTLEKKFNDNVLKNNEKISLTEFVEKTDIKLLKPKDKTINLNILFDENEDDDRISTWYEFDDSGWYLTNKYYIFAFRAYLNFDGEYDSAYECINDDCAGSIKKLLLDGKTEVLINTRFISDIEVKFFFDDVLYTFNYHEYRLEDKLKSDETRKQVFDNILDFIKNLEY